MTGNSAARILVLAALWAIAGTGCARPPAPLESGTDGTLDEAFRIAAVDPALAAALFAEAGPGPSLERARMEVWQKCLEATGAPPLDWRRYLEADPPPDLAADARIALIAALVNAGEPDAALAERALLPSDHLPDADELLLGAADESVREAAAARLVVNAPRRLARHDRELERRLLIALEPAQRLARGGALRREGQFSRAVAELGSLRFEGELERLRRREVALAELERGSSQAALRALPDGRQAAAEDHALRALAHRRRAWQQFPDRAASASFARCLESAARALSAGPTRDTLAAALELQLECATETGRLDAAFAAWRRLEGEGGSVERRSWLGRRLGVALAQSRAPEAAELIRALPEHERCLRFWIAVASREAAPGLAALAAAPVADLYARWARELGGRPPGQRSATPSILAPEAPPESVRRLLDAGSRGEAVRQWQRIRLQRPLRPAEALAAAELADAAGFANDGIRCLLSGFPGLGTTDMLDEPAAAVTAYLPLRWREELAAAAAESGLEPWLLAAVARQESVFSAAARSPRGAVGVLQLLPSTAAGHARALGMGGAPDLRDPAVNLRLGARELARLRQRFGALEPAVAAYNAGETRVRRWWQRQPDPRRFAEAIPIPETYTYVRRVLYLSDAYRLQYQDDWRRP